MSNDLERAALVCEKQVRPRDTLHAGSFYSAVKQCADAIRALPSPQAGWVSVKERLPEDGVAVLVYRPPSGIDEGGIGFDCRFEGGWQEHDASYEHYCAVARGLEGAVGPSQEAPYTHWMPLPSPPAAEPTGEVAAGQNTEKAAAQVPISVSDGANAEADDRNRPVDLERNALCDERQVATPASAAPLSEQGDGLLIRLRQFRGEPYETTECFNGLRIDAADTIEKLRSDLDAARRMLEQNEGRVKAIVDEELLRRAESAEAEAGRLREALEDSKRDRASDDCEFCELDGKGNHAPRCPEFLESKLAGLKPDHSCVPIARAPHMSEGRDWWIGKLTEPVAAWPKETHCLHMKTPLKDVVFLCNRGDFEALATLAACYFGHPINESWMSSVMKYAIDAARTKEG